MLQKHKRLHLQKYISICDQMMVMQISSRREHQHVWNHIVFINLLKTEWISQVSKVVVEFGSK